MPAARWSSELEPAAIAACGELVGSVGRGGEDGVGRERTLEGERVGVVRVAEGDQLGERAVRERGELGIHQRLVGAGGAAHGLRGVVDEDVERPLGGDVVRERHDLGGVAEVDADDAEPVDPVRGVGEAREPAHRIPREARGDRGVGAVAQQPQRDVHADLRAAAGEQGALAGEVGAGVALGVAQRRAGRAELVVERVDGRVRLLADVAGARLDELAGGRLRLGGERDAASLVIDAIGRAGRGGGHDRAVGLGDGGAELGAAHLLHRLEELGRSLAHGDEIRVILVELVELAEHAQRRLEIVGVDG